MDARAAAKSSGEIQSATGLGALTLDLNPQEAGRAAQQLEEFTAAREDWRRAYERDERIVFMATEGSVTAPVYRPSTYGLHTNGTYRPAIKHGRNTYLDQGVPSRNYVVRSPSMKL